MKDDVVALAAELVGVSSLTECSAAPTSESLLLLADERLYRSKDGGRNRVCSK